MSRRDRLGKGLGALLGEYLEPQSSEEKDLRSIPVKRVVPNPHQPRRVFTEEELKELADSIRENGLLQPLVVRPAPHREGWYELIAGERRLRAVTSLGWTEVPAVVREASDETLLVLAMVENLQREALNPIEEAEGYRALQERFNLTQGEVAAAVGKDRSTVANLVRLLGLPPSVRRMLEDGTLSPGHGRALLSVGDPGRVLELARTAVREGWSVREMERRAGSGAGGAKKRRRGAARRGPVVLALEDALQEFLSTRVQLRPARGGGGSVEIRYHGPEDFERIFQLITGRSVQDVVE